MSLILKIMAGLVGVCLMVVAGFALWLWKYPTMEIKTTRAALSDNAAEKSLEEIVDELLGRMTLDEKLDQMSGENVFPGLPKMLVNFRYYDRFPHVYTGYNRRLNIPPFAFSDGPRGAVVGGHRNTAFPVAMARVASWDVDLEARVADAMGKELRASGANYTGTPCINLLRHPGWGRAQETYGEDPHLLGAFGVAYVRAVQKHNVMATPKHFALNSIENARFYVDVSVDERALREVYLPHFRKVVQDGGAASIMSAYNRFRGNFSGESQELLTDILRDDWGFEGFVSSDWFFGVRDGVRGINAGLDIEMPFELQYRKKILRAAIEEGRIDPAQIDKIVRRILVTRLEYATAEDPMVYTDDLRASIAHRNLAREVAEQSMVLLKNDGVLPFAVLPDATIAVIGRLADVKNTGDHGSSKVRNPNVVTPFAGIAEYVEARGARAVLYDGDDGVAAAELAAVADKVVLVVGYTYEDEGEYLIPAQSEAENTPTDDVGGDRLSLELLPEDLAMIEAIKGANANTALVYVGGSAIVMEKWRQEMPAILFAWYAGMEGGHALANILFGEVNPSGKLPFTIPRDESHLPSFTPFAEKAEYGYYHGYTLLDRHDIEPAYAFGFGLDYTETSISNLTVVTPEVGKGEALRVTVDVRNTGERATREVLQLYVGFGQSSVDRPVKLLRDFKKVPLLPGETRTVELSVPVSDLSWYNPDEAAWRVEAMEYEVYVGTSSAEQDLLQASFIVPVENVMRIQ